MDSPGRVGVGTDDTELLSDHPLAPGRTFRDAARKVTITTLTDSGRPRRSGSVSAACATVSTQYVAAEVAAITARNIATAAKTSSANSGITADRAVRSRRCRGSYGDRLDVREPGRRLGLVQRQPRQPVRREHRQSRCAATHRVLGEREGRPPTGRDDHGPVSGRSTARRFRVPTISPASGEPRGQTRSSVRGANGSVAGSGPTVRTRQRGRARVRRRDPPRRGGLHARFRVHAASARRRPGSGDARIAINPGFKVVSATGVFDVGGTLSSAQQWRAAVVTFFAVARVVLRRVRRVIARESSRASRSSRFAGPNP